MTHDETYRSLPWRPAAFLIAALMVVNGCKRQADPAPNPPAATTDRIEIRPASSGERVRIHKLDQDGNETQMEVQYLDDYIATVTRAADGFVSRVVQLNPDGSRVCCNVIAPGRSNITFFDKDGVLTDQIEPSGNDLAETQMQNGKPFMSKTQSSNDNHYEVMFFGTNGVTPRIRFILPSSGIEGGAQQMFFYDTNGVLCAGSKCSDDSSIVLSKYGAGGVELYRQYWRTKGDGGSQSQPAVLESVEELSATGKVTKRIELPQGFSSTQTLFSPSNVLDLGGSSGGTDSAGIVVHEYDQTGKEVAARPPQPLDLSLLVEIPTPSLDEFVPYLESLDITPIPAHIQALIEEK